MTETYPVNKQNVYPDVISHSLLNHKTRRFSDDNQNKRDFLFYMNESRHISSL